MKASTAWVVGLALLTVLSGIPAHGMAQPVELMIGLHEVPTDLSVGDHFLGDRVTYIDRNVRFIVVASPEPTLTEARARLLSSIRYVERNEVVNSSSFSPNDPLFASQANIAQIRAPEAWQDELGDRATRICVVGVGVDYYHKDLADGYAGGYDFYSNDAEPLNRQTESHETRMTSIAAATINNGVNVTGVANVSYLAMKAAPDSSTQQVWSAPAASSMSWCANNTAHVYSLSFGGQTNHTDWYTSLAFAWYHRNAVIVASGGNNALSPIIFPGRYPFSLTATCVTATNTLCTNGAGMSSGPELEISAPGQLVWYALTDNATFVTQTGGASSEATAHVAGAAALLISEQPTLVNKVVKELIEESATDITAYGVGYDESTGYGLLNVESAIAPLLPTTLPTCRYILPDRGSVISGSVNISAYSFSPQDSISGVELHVDGTLAGTMTHHTADIVNDAYFLGNHTYYRSFDSTLLSDGNHEFAVKCIETDGGMRTVSRNYKVEN